MFGLGKNMNDLTSRLRPDLSRESLGVGADFPGVAPNPLLSIAAMRRAKALRQGELAIGTLVDWREVSSDGSPRVVLMFDVETAEGVTFRGIADHTITITDLTRLAAGHTFPVRYRPAIMDHCVALARDPDAAQVQQLKDRIAQRKGD